MLLEWGLILSVTLVSTTMLMMVSTYFAILPQASQFYKQSRTMVLLLSNSFNIFYIIISPLMFNLFNKHYFQFVLLSTIATSIGVIGRYLVGTNYSLALVMTIIVAIAHIPIITAPYGLLKLFPQWQRGYAASIPLFLPVLGINFCILYGMTYITDGSSVITAVEKDDRIHRLNAIIAWVGLIAGILTSVLLLKLKSKIQQGNQNSGTSSRRQNKQSFFEKIILYVRKYWYMLILVIGWGSIVGINWTYGSLFGIIFEGQGLSQRDIALIGLCANLSTAIFSNLGTFIRNRFNISNTRVIGLLNLSGFAAAILIQQSKFIPALQGLPTLIGLIIVLRAGYSSFVSLAFLQMESSGVSGVTVSGLFFWVANVVNLIGMEIVDLVNIDISMTFLTLTVAVCIHLVAQSLITSKIIDIAEK